MKEVEKIEEVMRAVLVNLTSGYSMGSNTDAKNSKCFDVFAAFRIFKF